VLTACGGGSDGGSNDEADASAAIDGGATPVNGRVCRTERIVVADQSVVHRSEYTWDVGGRIGVLVLPEGWDYLEEADDVSTEANHVLRRDLYYSYDYNGKLSYLEVDNGGDGTIDWQRYHYRDPASGLMTYWVEDTDVSNGYFDETFRVDYMNDADGRPIQEEGRGVASHVPSATLNYRKTYEYDANGRLEHVELNRINTMADCSEMRDTRFYDDNGRMIRLEQDGSNTFTATDCPTQGIDGVVDLIVYHDYDDDGRLIQRRYDTGADGSIERRETRFYDCP